MRECEGDFKRNRESYDTERDRESFHSVQRLKIELYRERERENDLRHREEGGRNKREIKKREKYFVALRREFSKRG